MLNPSKISSKYRATLIQSTFKKFLKRNVKILDLGCGTGVVSFYLQKRTGVKITGCDIKNYLLYPIPFIQIPENKRIPLENKSYEIIMINDVLHHVEKNLQKEILKEALRIGKNVLIFETKPTLLGKFFDIVLNKIHYGDLKVPLSFRDKSDWLKVFKELKVTYKIIPVNNPFIYPFSHIAFLITQHPKK